MEGAISLANLPRFLSFPNFRDSSPSYLDHSPSSTELDIKTISQNVKIVDITKKEITQEMLEQYDSLNESTADGPLPEGAYVEDVDLPLSDSDPNLPTAEEKAQTSDEHVESEDGPPITTSESNGIAEEGILPTGSREILPTESQEEAFNQLAIQQGSFHFATSSFSFPPDSSSLLSMGEGHRLGSGSMQEYYGSCLQVRPECSLKCTVMLTESHLIYRIRRWRRRSGRRTRVQEDRGTLGRRREEPRGREVHERSIAPKDYALEYLRGFARVPATIQAGAILHWNSSSSPLQGLPLAARPSLPDHDPCS